MSSGSKDHTAIVAALITSAAVVVAALIGAGMLIDDPTTDTEPVSAARTTTTPPPTQRAETTTTAATSPPTTRPPTTTSPPTTRPPTTTSPPTTRRTPPSTTEVSERTDVELVYAGDLDGCRLDIQVAIGDRVVVPFGSSFVMDDVLVGPQPYELGGVISCPTWGSCDAYGSGLLTVGPSSRVDISWANADIGVCAMLLS